MKATAEEIVLSALVSRRGDPGEWRYCQAWLRDGPGGAAGLQLVNRTLFTMLLTDVHQTWQRGWQPAELVRLARRRHTARHGKLMVDAIAAQMRAYAAVMVDPRWHSQLTALDARVWWEHDDHYLDRWAGRHGLNRAAAVDHFLDLLQLLRTAPAIERLVPIPGTTNDFQPASVLTTDIDQRMLHKIRALLAKAESTDFPQEAEAFTAKAQQLMARHSIDQALLDARAGGGQEPVTRRIGIDNPYEAAKTLLLQVVAEANRCRSVWTRNFGLATVVGYPADLDAVELLFTSLLIQATKAMTQARSANLRSYRQSFMTAYAVRIGERLNSATQEVAREMTGGGDLLPVLAARTEAVNNAFQKQFPNLTSHAARASNRDGWVSGRAAADRAWLHGRQAVTG